MSKVTRIDDGERQDYEPRTADEIRRDAEFIDLEEELHKKTLTSEDMKWEHTGRHIFRRKIDEIRR